MSIDKIKNQFKQKMHRTSLNQFGSLLSDTEIFSLCDLLEHHWRTSPLTPPVMVRSLVYRSLNPDKSIRQIVEELIAADLLRDEQTITKSAWCQARSRLPEEMLGKLLESTLTMGMERFGSNRRWHGKEVYLVDGSTISMPDEPELVEAFGYMKGKYGNSRFPVARIVALLHGATRMIAKFRIAPNQSSELELFRQMMDFIAPGSIWVGDVYYSTFAEFIFSLRAGVDWVTRLHQRRDAQALIANALRLGEDDWLVKLEASTVVLRQHKDKQFPNNITVRLIRHRYQDRGKLHTLWLVTSLLDPGRYSPQDIICLYRQRWGIETHYSYLKVTLEMSVLRSKTPQNIRREVGAIMLAHNLIWQLMHQAGEAEDVPVERISFKGTIQTVLAHGYRFKTVAPQQRPQLYRFLLQRIASHVNKHRPGRHEPRLIKRDPARYSYLRTSREVARRVA
jgi:hypothetical protein